MKDHALTQAMLGTVKDLASVVTYCTAKWEMFILRGQSQERLQWHQGITVHRGEESWGQHEADQGGLHPGDSVQVSAFQLHLGQQWLRGEEGPHLPEGRDWAGRHCLHG